LGRLAGTLLAALLSVRAVSAQEAPVQDNSFLLEEAYNQEEGIVQHINSFQRMRGGDWIASFTQEWPVPGQKHQLSYTIPYRRVDAENSERSGAGDVALNYRYQLAGSGATKFACTPRLSLLLPTGDEEDGLGSGGVGVQAAIAASTVLSDSLVSHSNVGVTHTPSARNTARQEAATTGYNLGQSLIWVVRREINLMLEVVWSRSEAVAGRGRTRWQTEAFVSPGLRVAFDVAGGLQIVPGLAFPIGIASSSGERGVLLYVSFEHPMWRARK
jgi:hypothetical protein